MKLPYLALLTVCSSAVHAVPTLDTSDYRTPTVVYTQPVATYTTTTVAAPSNYQLADSITRLQNDLTSLKSKVNDQSKTLSELKQRQEVINTSLERKLNTLAPLGYGATVVAPAVVAPPPVDAAHASASFDERSRYEAAYGTFRNRDYNQAIALFQSQLSVYPSGEYADNAYYWMGEAYLRKGDKNTALQMFNHVVTNYPRGGKVPDALLKLGMTQLSMNKRANAKEYFDFLINSYPGSPAAAIAITKRAQAGL